MEAATLPGPRTARAAGLSPAPGISLWRLLGWQFFLGRVGLIRGGRGRIWRRVLVGGLGALWLALLGFGVFGFLEQAEILYPQAVWLPDFCLQSAWLGALAATLFLNLGFLLHVLFFSPDLAFLMAAPVNARRIMLVRFVEGMAANAGIVALLTLPTTVAVGVRSEAGPFYYLLALPALCCFLAVPAALTFLLGIPLARRWSAARLKAFFSVTGFVVALILWALPYQLAAHRSEAGLWDTMMSRAAGLQGLFESPLAWGLPSTWAACVSVAAAHGEVGGALAALARLAVLGGALTALSVVLCADLYREGWIQLTTVDQNLRTRTPEWFRRLVLLPRPHRAFLIKDLCLIGRDFRLTFQLYSIGALLSTFPFIVRLSRGGVAPEGVDALMAMGCALGTTVIVACQAGMMVVPVEGLAGFRLVAAPLPRHELALTKWLVALTLSLPVVLLQWPVVRLGFGRPLAETLRDLGLALCGAMLGGGLGLLLGAALPNFRWDHPKRMVKPLAQMIWALGVAAIVLGMAVAGQLPGLLAATGPGLVLGWSLLALAPAGVGGAAAVIVAGRLISELEWDN